MPSRLTLLLLGFLCLLYIPYAGHYGLWDPWETHYGEVARQMVERNDWISLWWPGSPNEHVTFWSKPVLTFWLMALSMKLFGLGHPGLAHAAEMTEGWRAEWALRLPFVLLGIAGVWAVWHLVRRLCGARPALWSALILGTATQWVLISRQAMTDMAFITPMTVAIAYAALALLLPAAEVRAELPRRQVRLGRLRLSWPHDRAFYVFVGLFVICVVPQLVVDCVQLAPFRVYLGHHAWAVAGFVAMLPWVGLFLGTLLWVMAGRDRYSIYLWTAYLMGGLANLAKGPAGLALPALVLLVFLVVTGRWREVLRLEPVRGSLVFLCVGAPWYAAMLVRHGMPFWMEMIGDNYINRAQGRHGDRGTFEYYLRQIAAGLFPWSGVAAAALLACGRWLRQATGSPRRQLAVLCLCWFIAEYAVMALVVTKFHHYILPALPALCVLAGLLLDEIAAAPWRQARAALWIVAVPVAWLAGRDLANFPARIGWLFNYDYVNVPISGRPWPLVSIYGQRYEYGGPVLIFAVAAAALTAIVAWAGRPGAAPASGPGVEDDVTKAEWIGGGLLLCGLLIAASLLAPSPETVTRWSSSKLPADAVLPGWLRWGFLLPAACAGTWLFGARAVRQALGVRHRVMRAASLLLCLAVLWNAWVLDRFLVDISPHWSQKGVLATYYRLRKGPDEPVVVWYLFWRGENFYTKNQVYDPRLAPEEKTFFLGDGDTDKMQAYVEHHRGRRIFFLFERGRLERLRALLPADARQSLQVVDESNNKLYLAVAQL